MSDLQEFYNLTPDLVMAGVEAAGFHPTGEYLQLNSYENRVFDVRLEKGSERERIIVKFYRPQRWSRAAILEEHFFLEELNLSGIPAIAPLPQKNRETLSVFMGLHMAAFPKFLGRMPQELSLDDLKKIGRLLARLHNVGEQKPARHRPRLDVENFGWPALEILADFVAPEMWDRYEQAAIQILQYLEDVLPQEKVLRIHGDCHRGNLLQQDNREGEQGFFLVDFDDFCNGPVAQDFWMLFSGDKESLAEERDALLGGYEELRHFPSQQEKLFMPLRGLRIIHYAAWIARRWNDPTFPLIFPDYQNYTYWAEETEALERIAWSL
ncbi:MAG: serine/threonine protein kinase [Bdellovibrionales bacterium]